MKVGIIGAGLGGLLAGAILSSEGYRVDIYEKLPFIGGRFTSIEYKGYQVGTGALHMIPHGKRGSLAKLLRNAGCRVEIVDSKPEGEIYWKGERETLTKKTFPFKDVLRFYIQTFLSSGKKNPTLEEFGKGLDEKTRYFIKSFLGWSFSIFPDQIRFSKIIPIYKRTKKHKGPGVPVGGCKAVVEDLAEVVVSNDGKIVMEKVESIKAGKEIALYSREKKEYDVVISDVGHKLTMELLGRRYGTVKPESRGVKYTISIDEPFIEHSGVLFTLGMEIAGMNEVTNVDENLGKKHMLQAHQPLRNGTRAEIIAGLKNLKEILKGYKFEVIAIQSYKGDWPVNRVMAGFDEDNTTPYKNLYVVGDGAKGDDIEVDGVALGVEKVLEDLL